MWKALACQRVWSLRYPQTRATLLLLLLRSPQDCLALGSILAATDSVATLQVISQERFPLLYSVVFGEGVINDATSIVILGTIQVRARLLLLDGVP